MLRSMRSSVVLPRRSSTVSRIKVWLLRAPLQRRCHARPQVQPPCAIERLHPGVGQCVPPVPHAGSSRCQEALFDDLACRVPQPERDGQAGLQLLAAFQHQVQLQLPVPVTPCRGQHLRAAPAHESAAAQTPAPSDQCRPDYGRRRTSMYESASETVATFISRSSRLVWPGCAASVMSHSTGVNRFSL